MSNLNLVVLMGRLTRDPEMKYTPKGTAIARLGLAINRTWKSEGGEKKEETCFCDVTAFGKQAETLAQYFKKGSRIHLTGRLNFEQWEQEGQKRSKLGVVLESFQFLDSGKQSDGSREAAPKAPTQAEMPVDDGDSVPF